MKGGWLVNLPIRLQKDSREPIYSQIENQLKALIAGGNLPAGTALPSIRLLAKDLEVSTITTRRAYQNLENQGFIETIQGKGTFVATIDTHVKEEIKTTTVHQTFEQAIEIAIDYDYTFEQIETIFHDVLNTFKNNEKGK